ncbi:hypothetical protein [Bacillus cereus]|uniref:hypothetical protein n=1 Tax=Bacillus cereus TaxID=1396 RepID=UPI000BFC86B3|nr:hypothetical protein [Bacillus cereus]PGW10535.1 hypothetical protein COD97_16690 [Bacillus cereus]
MFKIFDENSNRLYDYQDFLRKDIPYQIGLDGKVYKAMNVFELVEVPYAKLLHVSERKDERGTLITEGDILQFPFARGLVIYKDSSFWIHWLDWNQRCCFPAYDSLGMERILHTTELNSLIIDSIYLKEEDFDEKALKQAKIHVETYHEYELLILLLIRMTSLKEFEMRTEDERLWEEEAKDNDITIYAKLTEKEFFRILQHHDCKWI